MVHAFVNCTFRYRMSFRSQNKPSQASQLGQSAVNCQQVYRRRTFRAACHEMRYNTSEFNAKQPMRLLEPKLCGRKVLDFRSIALSLSLCLLLSLSLSLPLSPCSFVSSFCIFLCFLSLLSILLSYVPLCVFMVLEVAIVSIHLLMLFMTFLNFEKVWICQGHPLFFVNKSRFC